MDSKTALQEFISNESKQLPMTDYMEEQTDDNRDQNQDIQDNSGTQFNR